MDNWSTEYKQRIVNDLNEAQDAVKETRRSLEARRQLNDELREENTVLRRRNNTLAAEIEALKRRLQAAEALATALDRANRLLTQVSVLAYKPEIQDHIPFGLADEVKDWVKDNGADIALREFQEAKGR